MTKLSVAKELKDILDGTSAHTVAQIWKEKNHWFIETNITKQAFCYNEESRIYNHCCNSISLKAVKQLLTNDF